ncbi:uncharacterized protein LOC119114917 [Pollicipes pollicipes]|uniref:uncharacterized protein LOC119114917 n=1 Tax=Pollicipes pollicipes TaxID=41117 RepID=UPI0018858CD3|nr:uncharacterized protein LOC119114917 [Pollicipes pollicipes]
MSFELLDTNANGTDTALDAPGWGSASVSCVMVTGSAVLLTVVCACLLGARMAKMVAACWFELLASAAGHIPYGLSQQQRACGPAGRAAMSARQAGESALDRRTAAALAEHQALVQSVQRDTELGLPPALPLPDGEEFPQSANHIHIRTAEQEKEIYQACIRPPPNRTVGSPQLSPPVAPPAPRPDPRAASGRLAANCAHTRPLRLEATKSATVIPGGCALTVVVPPRQRAPAAAQLLPYCCGGRRLAGIRLVGCRAAPPPPGHAADADA